MKKNENNSVSFIELNQNELSGIQGGSFAYDFGRFVRYCGIYFTNGTGIPGTIAANVDYAINTMQND